MTFKDCPNCGVEKIREGVRVCGECEVAERYETKLAEAEAECDKLRAEVILLRADILSLRKAGSRAP